MTPSRTTARSPRRIAVAVALACAAWTGTGHGATDWRAPRIVTWECAGCHAIDGNSQWPAMPRLAGQNAAYLQQQITAFKAAPPVPSVALPAWMQSPAPPAADARDGADARTYMIGPAHALSSVDAQAATEWYARQRPSAGTPGDPTVIARGRDLYEHGDAKSGVIACQDCHGVDGAGLATFPRLAGQHAAYLVRQLTAFALGERPPGAPMHGIAKGLSAEDRAAVAAYLQSL